MGSSLKTGIAAKPMLVTFPFLLLLLDYWPLKRGNYSPTPQDTPKKTVLNLRKFNSLIMKKIPLIMLSVIFSIITIIAQHKAGAVAPMTALTLGMRLSNAVVAYVEYILNMLMPIGLGVFYPHPGDGIQNWVILVSGIFIALCTYLFIRLNKDKLYLIVGWLWYLGTLLPVIGIVQVGMQAMADRYTYIPSIGIFIMMAWLIPDLFRQKRKILIVSTVILFLSLSVFMVALTKKQVKYWTNTATLFSRTDQVTEKNILAKMLVAADFVKMGKITSAKLKYEEILHISPNNVTANYQHGMLLASQREFKNAVKHLQEAVRLQPTSVMAKNGLGSIFMWSGELEKAKNSFLEALQLDPNSASTHYNLGQLAEKEEQFDDAIRYYQQTLQLKSDYGSARLSLATLLFQLDRTNEAKEQYHRVLRDHPHVVAETHFLMGRNLSWIGKFDDAVNQFEEGMIIEPGNTKAMYQLAEILRKKGALPEAVLIYKEILNLKPNQGNAQVGIGQILLEQGKYEETLQHFRSIIPEHNNNIEALIWLGKSLEKKNLLEEAIQAYRTALKIDHEDADAHYYLGKTLIATNHTSEGIAHLRKVLFIRPRDEKTLTALREAKENLNK